MTDVEPFPYTLDLDLDLDDPVQARAVEGALAPEAEGEDGPRLRATLEREGLRLHLRVEARDASTLRAAVNSHLRWIRAALEVAALVGPDPKG